MEPPRGRKLKQIGCGLDLRIGQRLRYGRFSRFPASVPLVDGMANWWHVTRPPSGSGLPAVMLEAGINAPAATAAGSAEGRVALLTLRSSPHKKGSAISPWEDVHRPDVGYSRYYGDNRADKGTQAHETLGNQRLLAAAELHWGDLHSRRAAPPVLVFEGFEYSGRAKGQVEFVGLGVVSRVELVVQQDSTTGANFTNYRYDLVLLDLSADDETVSWDWINARRDPSRTLADSLELAPQSWRAWVAGGTPLLERLQRNVVKTQIVPETEQRPKAGSKEAVILDAVIAHYRHSKHRFEVLADFVTGEILRGQGVSYRPGWITRGSGDGGVDFVGRIDLDPTGAFPSSRMVLLGQAKCEALDRGTNGKHIARLAARLRRGWIGSYVTTSYFSRRVQQEVLIDRYPVLLVHGGRLATVLSEEIAKTGKSIDELLDSLDASYDERLGWGDPDQVLF